MTKSNREGARWWVFGLSLTCLVAVVLAMGGGSAYAKKPAPPPPDPELEGVIFLGDALDGYWASVEQNDAMLWTVAADGSGLTQTSIPAGRISHVKHGSSYWCLYFADVSGTNPDGTTRHGLFAARISDGETVTLIDDVLMHFHDWRFKDWTADDDAILFSGIVWNTDGSTEWIESSGIYRLAIAWDASGEPSATGETAQLIDLPTYVVAASYSPLYNHIESEACGWFSQAADESYLAFVTEGPLPQGFGQKFNVADADYDIVLSEQSYGGAPAYSPDGSVLAYGHDGDLLLANPDSTDPVVLVSSAADRKTYYHPRPPKAWSPDGGHIAFTAARGSTRDIAGTAELQVDIVDVDTGDVLTVVEGEYIPLAWRP